MSLAASQAPVDRAKVRRLVSQAREATASRKPLTAREVRELVVWVGLRYGVERGLVGDVHVYRTSIGWGARVRVGERNVWVSARHGVAGGELLEQIYSQLARV